MVAPDGLSSPSSFSSALTTTSPWSNLVRSGVRSVSLWLKSCRPSTSEMPKKAYSRVSFDDAATAAAMPATSCSTIDIALCALNHSLSSNGIVSTAPCETFSPE